MSETKLAPAGCEGCIDLAYDGLCKYNLRTGMSRGCPPGEGCTVKTVGPRPKPACQLPPRRASGWEDRYWRPSKPTPSLIALGADGTARRLYAQGARDPEIARATGWSVTTVRNWRRQTGRPSNYDRQRRMPNGNQSDDPAGGAG